MKAFKVYDDPGHAWVAVKRKFLVELGILEKITRCSYQRGQTVYLEEDCDAATFVKAFKERFGSVPLFAEQSHTENYSPIRSYDHFSLEDV